MATTTAVGVAAHPRSSGGNDVETHPPLTNAASRGQIVAVVTNEVSLRRAVTWWRSEFRFLVRPPSVVRTPAPCRGFVLWCALASSVSTDHASADERGVLGVLGPVDSVLRSRSKDVGAGSSRHRTGATSTLSNYRHHEPTKRRPTVIHLSERRPRRRSNRSSSWEFVHGGVRQQPAPRSVVRSRSEAASWPTPADQGLDPRT